MALWCVAYIEEPARMQYRPVGIDELELPGAVS
jgi:hypothetical protein